MVKLAAIALALTLGAAALAAEGAPAHTVDLRSAAALEQLRRSNPAHYAKIRQILAGLREQPERVEGDWLETRFDAHGVELSRFLFKTSDPPKQELRFTLDDVRYVMHVTRSDIAAAVAPARKSR